MTQAGLNRQYYQRIGYCPRCSGKNKLIGDEKSCPECKAKAYATFLKRDKEHFNEVHKEWSKKKYQERKEQGICVRCGKRKAQGGQTRCEFCAAKDNETRHIRDFKPTRFERGLCRFCDNPVEEGYKVCEYHHQMNTEKARNQKRERHFGLICGNNAT